ncbi:MAG: hypothetical protein QOG52_2409 [Frankiaceae bacterium]|nr:hypothetical protein [Frankiaceae bacterium]
MSRDAGTDSGPPTAVSVALSVLDLSPCESELLARAQISGSAATTPSQTSEWSRTELSDAADSLQHVGLLDRGDSPSSVVLGADVELATTGKAIRDGIAPYSAERREQLHGAIMRRVVGDPVRFGASGDLEREFLDVIQGHRVFLNSYPARVFEWPREEGDRALGAINETPEISVQDVVSSGRLRVGAEIAFFRAVDRFPNCSVGVADDVPLRLTLLDDGAAVIPLDPHAPPRAGGWVIRDPEAVAQVALQLAMLLAESKPLAVAGRAPIELAPREALIVRLLSAGLTDEAIGRRLKIADRTVRRIVAHLLAKLGVDSRFELAVECARRNLV